MLCDTDTFSFGGLVGLSNVMFKMYSEEFWTRDQSIGRRAVVGFSDWESYLQ